MGLWERVFPTEGDRERLHRGRGRQGGGARARPQSSMQQAVGKSQGVSPSHGSAEFSSMDEGEDIFRESIIVSCMKDATRGPMNGEKGPPVSR